MSPSHRSPASVGLRAAPDDVRASWVDGIGCSDISPQAIRLHAFGLIAAIRAGSAGVIGRAEGEELALESGALVEEVVDSGLWLETDLSFVVRAGSFAAALEARPAFSPRD